MLKINAELIFQHVKFYRLPLSLTGLLSCTLIGLPCSLSAWEPGYAPAPSRMYAAGFAVDNQDRNDVISFWHAVYQASEGYESRIKWTGNYSGKNGTVSGPFTDDVERRLNYFRAMCGVDTHATVNSESKVVVELLDLFKPALSTPKWEAAQSAALMMAVNFDSTTGLNPALSHNPLKSVKSWSPVAWNASAKGNFAFGLYGPGAVTEYMLERLSKSASTSSWNSSVGHRRWCLYPAATDFATGDQPGTSAYNPPTNVFYVAQHHEDLLEITDPKFVAYPAAGFFPAVINSPFWSLSRQGANFSSAKVRMTDAAGKVIPITSTRINNEYGDPAIVWQVSASVAITEVYTDTKFNVQVSGISGEGVPATYDYSVTLINPNRLLDNHTITGVSKLASTGSAKFTFKVPGHAEALQVVAAQKSSTVWKETAEKAAKVIDRTASTYPLQVKTTSFAGFGIVSGQSSFRLTFPNAYDMIARGVPEQSFELDRDILPKKNAKLKFLYRRGYMTKGSVLAVEISSNDGVTWKTLGTPIKGVNDTKFDMKATAATLALPKSTIPIRIRFRYYTTGGAIYTHEAAKTSPTGIFLDDITVTKCDWLETKKVNSLSSTATAFSFTKGTAGVSLVKGKQWYLRLRAKVGGRWFHHGPPKAISITAP